jgi:hypothetical protein
VAELLTLFDVRGLISWHVALGALLVPPAVMKTASTGWRMARYYAGVASYRQAGPPPLLLRLLGPLVVVSTLGLLATGVLLLMLGQDRSRQSLFTLLGLRVDWLSAHQWFFAVWAVAAGLHLLGRIGPGPASDGAAGLGRRRAWAVDARSVVRGHGGLGRGARRGAGACRRQLGFVQRVRRPFVVRAGWPERPLTPLGEGTCSDLPGGRSRRRAWGCRSRLSIHARMWHAAPWAILEPEAESDAHEVDHCWVQGNRN